MNDGLSEAAMEDLAEGLRKLHPEVADLPDPPLRVFARHQNDAHPCWWLRIGDMRRNSFGLFVNEWGTEEHASELTVVPHPQNDPEAVKIIEAAK